MMIVSRGLLIPSKGSIRSEFVRLGEGDKGVGVRMSEVQDPDCVWSNNWDEWAWLVPRDADPDPEGVSGTSYPLAEEALDPLSLDCESSILWRSRSDCGVIAGGKLALWSGGDALDDSSGTVYSDSSLAELWEGCPVQLSKKKKRPLSCSSGSAGGMPIRDLSEFISKPREDSWDLESWELDVYPAWISPLEADMVKERKCLSLTATAKKLHSGDVSHAGECQLRSGV